MNAIKSHEGTVWATFGQDNEASPASGQTFEASLLDLKTLHVFFKREKNERPKAKAGAKEKKQKVELLDGKRAQNIGIVVATLGRDTTEICSRMTVLDFYILLHTSTYLYILLNTYTYLYIRIHTYT